MTALCTAQNRWLSRGKGFQSVLSLIEKTKIFFVEKEGDRLPRIRRELCM
jgi:hypothetical protein